MIKKLGIGPCMDICSYNDSLYAIQNSEQYTPSGRICRIDKTGKVVSEFCGIGNARQIKIDNGIAVVCARDCGLWLFDVAGDNIQLLSHYLTIEYATGVTLYSNLALISCRQYGVEIVDISNPKCPKHIGIIRIGEVQSACVYNGFLFGGVWGDMNVAIVDIRNIQSPKLVGRIKLSGRGDGVVVKDGILYAAIGHHRCGIKNISDKDDPMYGMGNGFEVFDVHDVNNVKKLHTEFTEKRYYPSFDTWKPYISGDKLIVTNSTLGLYVYDINTYKLIYHFTPDAVGDKLDAVVSAAVLHGELYFSTGLSDIYKLEKTEYEDTYKYNTDKFIQAVPSPFYADSERLQQVYFSEEYPVLDVCKAGDFLGIALGNSVLAVIDKSGKEVARHKTDGFCTSVKSFGKYIFSTESESGLSVYEFSENKLSRISNISFEAPALQLAMHHSGNYLLIGCGCGFVACIDVKDKYNPKETARRNLKFGPLYGENFASHELNDGTMLLFWHRDGLVYIGPDDFTEFKEVFYKKHISFMGFGPENGLDTDGENIFYNLDGGYIILPIEENIYTDELDNVKPEIGLYGKFIISNNMIYCTQRADGDITVTDISDLKSPKSITKIHTSASPFKPVEIDGNIYIPACHGGLLLFE